MHNSAPLLKKSNGINKKQNMLVFSGLCSNTNCPYRHVKVKSTSSVCEGFLKGYCSDGDEVPIYVPHGEFLIL